MILKHEGKQVGFFPNEDGDVLCIHCQREDNIHLTGPNQLIGCEPENGIRLYIHAAELRGYEGRPHEFINTYYRANAAAIRGETAH